MDTDVAPPRLAQHSRLAAARFVAGRVLSSVILLLVLIVVMFILLRLTPGDPVQALVGNVPATPAYRQQLIQQYHLNAPAIDQFFSYLSHVVRGDLGYSVTNHAPVATLILQRLGNTLLLMVTGLVLAAILGVLVAVVAVRTRHRWLDQATNTFSLAGFSMPSFWLGQILILVFAVNLRVLPAQGIHSPYLSAGGVGALGDLLQHLVLPVATLTVIELGFNARVARASLREVLSADYLDTARMKGLPEATVFRRHVVRNGILPIVTVIGYGFGYALAGSVLIETVFAWPGMGLLLYQSIESSDHQLTLGILLVSGVVVVIVNLLTDLSYRLIDPRTAREETVGMR